VLTISPEKSTVKAQPLDTQEVVRIGGLRNILQSKVDKKEDQITKSDILQEDSETASNLTILEVEQAKRLFKSYAEELNKQKRTSLAAFFSDPLLKMEDNVVVFTVGSKIVESEILEEKQKLVSFFKKQGFELNDLICHVNAKQISEYKVFTSKQQFDLLVKDFPKLKDLSERFYLDFD